MTGDPIQDEWDAYRGTMAGQLDQLQAAVWMLRAEIRREAGAILRRLGIRR